MYVYQDKRWASYLRVLRVELPARTSSEADSRQHESGTSDKRQANKRQIPRSKEPDKTQRTRYTHSKPSLFSTVSTAQKSTESSRSPVHTASIRSSSIIHHPSGHQSPSLSIRYQAVSVTVNSVKNRQRYPDPLQMPHEAPALRIAWGKLTLFASARQHLVAAAELQKTPLSLRLRKPCPFARACNYLAC